MTTIKQKLQPFQTPNYIKFATKPGKRQDGFKEVPKLHLHEVPEQTLIEMCDEFKRAVLAKHRNTDGLSEE